MMKALYLIIIMVSTVFHLYGASYSKLGYELIPNSEEKYLHSHKLSRVYKVPKMNASIPTSLASLQLKRSTLDEKEYKVYWQAVKIVALLNIRERLNYLYRSLLKRYRSDYKQAINEINNVLLPQYYLDACGLILQPLLPYAFTLMQDRNPEMACSVKRYCQLSVCSDLESLASLGLLQVNIKGTIFSYPEICILLPSKMKKLEDLYFDYDPYNFLGQMMYLISHELGHFVGGHLWKKSTLSSEFDFLSQSYEFDADVLSLDIMGSGEACYGEWISSLVRLHVQEIFNTNYKKPTCVKQWIVETLDNLTATHPRAIDRIKHMLCYMVQKGAHHFERLDGYLEQISPWASRILSNALRGVQRDLLTQYAHECVFYTTINVIPEVQRDMELMLEKVQAHFVPRKIAVPFSRQQSLKITDTATSIPLDALTSVSLWEKIGNSLRNII